MALIELRDVTKSYKRDTIEIPVLERVSISVPEGDFLGLMGFENVELPLLLTNLSKKQRRDHVMTALGIVGLGDREKHYPRQLSGGQEQRVAIARAIVTDPTLLLADEPTGDLDAKSAGEVLTLLQRLNTEYQKTIVMVTHDPHAAERAKRVLHLEKGTLVEAQQPVG